MGVCEKPHMGNLLGTLKFFMIDVFWGKHVHYQDFENVGNDMLPDTSEDA